MCLRRYAADRLLGGRVKKAMGEEEGVQAGQEPLPDSRSNGGDGLGIGRRPLKRLCRARGSHKPAQGSPARPGADVDIEEAPPAPPSAAPPGMPAVVCDGWRRFVRPSHQHMPEFGEDDPPRPGWVDFLAGSVALSGDGRSRPPRPPMSGGQWWRADARRCWTGRDGGVDGCLRVAVRRWDRDVDTTLLLKEVWVMGEEGDSPSSGASPQHASGWDGNAGWDDAEWEEHQLDTHLEEEEQPSSPMDAVHEDAQASFPGAVPRAAPPPGERRYAPLPSAGGYVPLPWDEDDPEGVQEARLRGDAANHPWCQAPLWQGRQHLPLKAAQRAAREAASADLRPGPTAPLRWGSAPPPPPPNEDRDRERDARRRDRDAQEAVRVQRREQQQRLDRRVRWLAGLSGRRPDHMTGGEHEVTGAVASSLDARLPG